MVGDMKLTKKLITAYVRRQLSTNRIWALKALVRIFKENQTETEQAIEATKEDNGIGFTGLDGAFLSSLAKQAIAKGTLSEKQMVIVFKKMPKYHGQVIKMSDQAVLEKMVIADHEKSEQDYESDCETQEARRNEVRAHG